MSRWLDFGSAPTAQGYKEFSASHMLFLANLECGVTHASLVAKRMGVTRQAVYKKTKELQELGILTLENDPRRRNQKIIGMTPHGKKVVTDARRSLEAVEATIRDRLGIRSYERLGEILMRDWGPMVCSD